ncbi:hypothetical protein Tco_0032131 [Tanacetum coccineum]
MNFKKKDPLDYDSQMTDKYFVEYTRIEVKHFKDTLLQHMGNVKNSVAKRTRHQRQYDRRMNKRQLQTQESKIDPGKAVDNGEKGSDRSYALSWKPCQGDSLNLPEHRAQVDQGSQIKMIQVKEMMQDNDLKNSKSKDKGSKSRSQSMNEQSHYKQDKTITRQSINVKRHIFNVIGGIKEFEERDLNIGGDY